MDARNRPGTTRNSGVWNRPAVPVPRDELASTAVTAHPDPFPDVLSRAKPVIDRERGAASRHRRSNRHPARSFDSDQHPSVVRAGLEPTPAPQNHQLCASASGTEGGSRRPQPHSGRCAPMVGPANPGSSTYVPRAPATAPTRSHPHRRSWSCRPRIRSAVNAAIGPSPPGGRPRAPLIGCGLRAAGMSLSNVVASPRPVVAPSVPYRPPGHPLIP